MRRDAEGWGGMGRDGEGWGGMGSNGEGWGGREREDRCEEGVRRVGAGLRCTYILSAVVLVSLIMPSSLSSVSYI